MGEAAVVMQEYLGDAYRFADLFNVVFFQGEQVIEPQMLSEQSERYAVHPPKPQGHPGGLERRPTKKTRERKTSGRIPGCEEENGRRYHVPDIGGGGAKLCGLYNASALHGI